MGGSVFLEIPQEDWLASNALAFAFLDRYPVTPGHTLVVTREVVPDWFHATAEQQQAVMSLVNEVKRLLDARTPKPAGYNVGFNAGAAAGQTIPHLHLHVIPRYVGDMDDPTGGVRHVIPSKGNYRTQASPLSMGGEGDPFSRHILPVMVRAQQVAIVAAFVQESGLARLEASILAALGRGASVRILTGDYLDITQVSALELLLDWQRSTDGSDGDELPRGLFEARVIEVSTLLGRTKAFHPKSWIFEGNSFGIAWVGSSNLSYSALETGIEWNLRVDRDRDGAAWARINASFEGLWSRARELDEGWIAAYALRARRAPHPLPSGEVEPEALAAPPTPHEVQCEALAALRKAREEGRRRALVVLATGLGKTWLAAFDWAQLRDELGRTPRVLFLAHRRELLRQAARTYRRQLRTVDPTATLGWFNDEHSNLDATLVFASIPRLARQEHLAKLTAQRFDYVVVDEVHHAAADTYRRLLDALDPGFLLGLTATPSRADGADILGLFDDFTAYQADLGRGIELGRLVPFNYFGVKDALDYSNLPWRNHRFDPAALAAAVQTEQRMQTLWRAWEEHPGARSLVFCCSVEHAKYVRAWLQARGLRVAAVFADEGSDDRDEALRQLEAGELDAVCAVDMFNEGLDVPNIDRVVMLRPTESEVVFLQQLGRGLRAIEGKASVTVIDFVGNHRVFLSRLATLLDLAGSRQTVRALLEQGPQPAELPPGCSIELELEAVDLLRALYVSGGADEVERAYRELRLQRDARPTAGELFLRGLLPSRLRARHGSWFGFVSAEGDASDVQRAVLAALGKFLEDVEVTRRATCLEMVTLEALLELAPLSEGVDEPALARRSHAILRRTPALFADILEAERVEVLDEQSLPRWVAYWRRDPLRAWCDSGWFRVEQGVFRFVPPVPAALEEAFRGMVRELVDYRLAQYRRRAVTTTGAEAGFTCRVTWNQRDPILNLPAPRQHVPEGETDVRLPDGSLWSFRFARSSATWRGRWAPRGTSWGTSCGAGSGRGRGSQAPMRRSGSSGLRTGGGWSRRGRTSSSFPAGVACGPFPTCARRPGTAWPTWRSLARSPSGCRGRSTRRSSRCAWWAPRWTEAGSPCETETGR